MDLLCIQMNVILEILNTSYLVSFTSLASSVGRNDDSCTSNFLPSKVSHHHQTSVVVCYILYISIEPI